MATGVLAQGPLDLVLVVLGERNNVNERTEQCTDQVFKGQVQHVFDLQVKTAIGQQGRPSSITTGWISGYLDPVAGPYPPLLEGHAIKIKAHARPAVVLVSGSADPHTRWYSIRIAQRYGVYVIHWARVPCRWSMV
jgi:hypothetical protein